MNPVVVVGGGLAGLVVARELHRNGRPFILFDAYDDVGGRLRTDVVKGFRLDRGFQVYFDAYPHAGQVLDHKALKLECFERGALIFDGNAIQRLDSSKPIAMLRDKHWSFGDKYRLFRWASHLAKADHNGIQNAPEQSAAEYFKKWRFSAQLVKQFLQPFYAAIFVDPDLATSSRRVELVTKMMVTGRTCVPSIGMAEIPRQLASELPSHCVRLDCRVASIDRGSNGEVCGVTLDTGESFEASAVVVATDGVTAQRLSGTKTVEGFSTSVCLYFASDEPLVHGKYIVLNGSGKGMVQEVVPVTNVAPQHAPSGRHLTSVTLLGSHDIPDDQLAQSVMKEIAAWFPEADLKSFELLKVYRITHHQFKQGVGYRRELPKISTDVPGLYFAGEFTTNSSIDGAVESGLRCASILLKG